MRTLLCGLILALLPALAGAKALQVGVRETPPFAQQNADGSWSGISVELWEHMASTLDLDYAFIVQPRLEPMFAALESGRLDVAIGALTVTARREAAVDFTHPFFNAGLGIAVQHREPSLWRTAGALLSPRLWSAVAGLSLLLLVVGVLIWVLERRANPQFPKQPGAGIGDGFWWSAVTMTTVGYGDKAPITFAGRTLAVVWMFVGIITISGFTAAITSSLTLQELDGRIRGLEDLRRNRVATVADSTAAQFLDRHALGYLAEANASEALRRLSSGEADAVVYDSPVLRHLLLDSELRHLRLLPRQLDDEAYAVALSPGSALREPLNRQLLAYRAGPEWPRLLARYLGS